MGPFGKPARAVIAAFVGVVVLLPAEGAAARTRKKPQPKDLSAPLITHEALSTHGGAPPLFVRATIEDDSGVFEPTLVVRNPGGTFARVPMAESGEEPGVYVAEVPAELLGADLEYLIEAFDTHGNGPARAGAEDAPLVVHRDAPQPTEPTPVTPTSAPKTKPADEESSAAPIWIGAGVATGVVLLVGAGVAVAYFLLNTAEPDPTSTRVTVEGPAPVAALRVRGTP